MRNSGFTVLSSLLYRRDEIYNGGLFNDGSNVIIKRGKTKPSTDILYPGWFLSAQGYADRLPMPGAAN